MRILIVAGLFFCCYSAPAYSATIAIDIWCGGTGRSVVVQDGNASLSVGWCSAEGNGLGARAQVDGHGATAGVSVEVDYLLTFTGGSGSAVYQPCFEMQAYTSFLETHSPKKAGATAVFGSVAVQGDPFGPNGCIGSEPFEFGQPIAVHASFQASASELAWAHANLTGFQVLDSNLEPLTGWSYELTDAGLPEPSATWLLPLPLLLLFRRQILLR